MYTMIHVLVGVYDNGGIMVVSAWPVAWQHPTWHESLQREPTEQIQTAAVGR